MNCPKCGEVCSCCVESLAAGVPIGDTVAQAALLESESAPYEQPTDVGVAWRDELASRLNRYRARRKAPPPRYPSLRLPFDRGEATAKTYARTAEPPPATFEPISSHALALDGMHSLAPPAETKCELPAQNEILASAVPESAAAPTAKIIEFPRYAWAPPPPPPDQLAEPVMDRPRILEVPEVAPPPPALGGITIETVQVPEPAKQPGIDVPLGCAPLGRRVFASLTDGLIVGVAAGLFGFVFWKVAGIRPPQFQMLGISAGIIFLFWQVYQYLLIVHSGRTPGMLVARLELARFDGTSAKRSLRRWRVVASFLSAVSLGMGYAWVFLDEESLCWHDRITRTYLASRKLDTNKPQR